MKTKDLGFAVVIVVGAFSLLAVAPASALFCGLCSCSSSCSQICINGPEIPDCPGCNESTCGAYTCVGSYGCEGECDNNACTTNIYGTSGSDTLNGTSANECIYGYGGNDTIYGNAGDDTVYASSGNDTVYGGSGDDCMHGEGGNDSLNGDSGSSDFADGGSGTDTCNAETEINCEI